MTEFRYKPDGDTLRAFMRDGTSFARLLRGPVGSGKSVCAAVTVMMLALAQKPGPDGIKRSRWAVVRNSYPELRTTTIKTWLDWFPEDVWGKMVWNPPPYVHPIRKGDLELETFFIALDRPDDVKKLLSLELTGVWVNEAREVSKTIIDACSMRVGRYPSMRDGGPSWYGLLADTNSPDEEHWWSIMSGEALPPDWMTPAEIASMVKPQGWTFYTQPSAMLEKKNAQGDVTGYELNPERENGKNLTPDYYQRIIAGKDADWISVYVLNRIGGVRTGKPIFPEWQDGLHLSKTPLEALEDVPLTVGVDFGLTPAAVIAQQVRGIWRVLGELVSSDMGATRFSQLLKRELAQKWPNRPVRIYGDPAGDQRAQTDERTPFQVFAQNKLPMMPAPSNDVALRQDAVKSVLGRLIEGVPSLTVDPSCKTLIAGFRGQYAYRRLKVSGEKYADTPDKNRFSHVHDAFQYLLLGGGEGRALTVGTEPKRPVVAQQVFSPFDRRGKVPKNRAVRFGPL